jgi:hypothetical protein
MGCGEWGPATARHHLLEATEIALEARIEPKWLFARDTNGDRPRLTLALQAIISLTSSRLLCVAPGAPWWCRGRRGAPLAEGPTGRVVSQFDCGYEWKGAGEAGAR